MNNKPPPPFPLEKNFDYYLSERNKLINDLPNLSVPLQLKTVQEINKIDIRIASTIDAYTNIYGHGNLLDDMKSYIPFELDIKHAMYIKLFKEYHNELNEKTVTENTNIIKCEGIVWKIVYNGKDTTIKDTLGMHIIALLIKFQGQELRADSLYNSMAISNVDVEENYNTMSPEQLADQENLSLDSKNKEKMTFVDRKSIDDATRRIEDIEMELSDPEISLDILTCEKLESEKGRLESLLSKTTDKYNNPREISDATERCRKAAIEAVKVAKNNIRKKHEKLFQHFDEFLVIRKYSYYRPIPDPNWIVET